MKFKLFANNLSINISLYFAVSCHGFIYIECTIATPRHTWTDDSRPFRQLYAYSTWCDPQQSIIICESQTIVTHFTRSFLVADV